MCAEPVQCREEMCPVIQPEPCPMGRYLKDLRPAPYATVAIRSTAAGLPAYLRGLLDLGADRSQLAWWAAAELEAVGLNHVTFLWHDERGERVEIKVYRDLEFSFDGGTHWYPPDHPVEYVENEQAWKGMSPERAETEGLEPEDLLVGRDILHQVVFCYQGPDDQFSLRVPARQGPTGSPA